MAADDPPNVDRVRGELEAEGLADAAMRNDPFHQFDDWYGFAREVGVFQPEAMALATAATDAAPSVRLVLLRGHDERGFVFFTNYDSRKSREIDEVGRAAVVFVWHAISRQVRIEGTVERADASESDAYFASRPRGSQLGAWASPQSEMVADRSALDALVAQEEARWAGRTVERPPYWGGYRIVPSAFEFWQGRADRLHDRFRYERVPEADPATTPAPFRWRRCRLAP